MQKSRMLRAVLIIFASILLLLLLGPFLVPVPPLEGTKPIAELADPDSMFVEINGLTTHYKTRGADEPVFVLLHGFGASLYSWNAVLDPLGERGTVIAYDRPAFGLTERPLTWEGDSPYSPQAQVDLLLGLLDHFGVQKAVLVGNSAGGTVAMNFYLQHPERVQALILVDPAVYAGGAPAGIRWLLRTPQMRHLGPLIARQIQSRGPELIELAWYDPSHISEETLALYQKPLQVENWDWALWELTLASEESGLAERLDEFTVPTLVVTGEADRIVPTEQSIQLAGELPQARLVVISQAGHVPHEEQPAAFLEAVDMFLTTLGQ